MPGSTISFVGSTNADQAQTQRNLAAVGTLEELTRITPKAFAPRLSILFRKYSDLAVKASHVAESLRILEQHFANGTFPPQVTGSIKSPVTQVTKEFEGHDDRTTCTSEVDAAIHVARVTTLQSLITAKKSEHAILMSMISTEAMTQETTGTLNEVHVSIGTSFATGKNEKGQTVYADFYQNEFLFVRKNVLDFARKATSLGFSKHQKELVARIGKLKIKKDTDVAMRELPANDVKKQIDLAVREALKKAPRKNQPKSEPTDEMSKDNITDVTHRQKTSGQKQTQNRDQETTQQGERSRKRKREWEQETQEKMRKIELDMSSRFNPRDTFSYPDSFFNADIYTRTKFCLLHSSLDFVDSIPSYQADVFSGPGVHLDQETKQKLSLNGKFVLHAQKNPNLIPEAVQQLKRSVRIRWFFRRKPQKQFFNKKFHTKSEWDPPKADPQIEEALRQVEVSLLSQTNTLPSKSYLLNPETKNLCQTLREKQYLVKITDKNLGLAVISSEWYMEQCEKHLRDLKGYEEVAKLNLEEIGEDLNHIMNTFTFSKEVKKYIATTTADLPRFHVIPKVHKTPWASRPIVPSHSWATSRCSEVVDYYLQKFTRKVPWILDSTKSFIQKIKGVQQTNDKMWVVTGDVKAMYTNIPVTGAKKVNFEALKKVDTEEDQVEGLGAMLFYVLDNNFFKFQDKTFKQKNGIAMGTACAPAVANIYASFYENDFIKYWSERGLSLFCRYIDDIFIVFQGLQAELQECLDQFHIPGLEIDWNISTTKATFLDVQVSVTPKGLETTLFRKELNKYMYIPFSSAHPMSVKKALVKAERTRMKTICSTDEERKECEKVFKLNLYRRGYPSTLLERWFSEDVKPPLEKKERKFLLLPSSYNPVWEYMDMSKLENTWMMKTRKVSGLPEDLQNPRFIKCLGRGFNMYDLYNRENLTILNDIASLGEQ